MVCPNKVGRNSKAKINSVAKNVEFYNVAQKFSDKWVALKSSMDPCEIIDGRPYGGIGFICSKIEGITFQSIDVESDRIWAIQLSMNRKVLINVIGVYLPYNSGTSECMVQDQAL